MCLYPHVVHKGKHEQVWGRTRRQQTRSDRENHEFQKVTKQGPRTPKLSSNEPRSGPPDLPYGPASSAQHPLVLRFDLGRVCVLYVIFSSISLSISNRIEIPLIKQL
jgi:hypothetical protein